MPVPVPWPPGSGGEIIGASTTAVHVEAPLGLGGGCCNGVEDGGEGSGAPVQLLILSVLLLAVATNSKL